MSRVVDGKILGAQTSGREFKSCCGFNWVNHIITRISTRPVKLRFVLRKPLNITICCRNLFIEKSTGF